MRGAGPRGPYAKGERRREEIIDAACAVVSSIGVNRASLAKVATAAGITVAGLVHYFPSRERMVSAVVDRWGAEDDAIADAVGLGEGLEYFRALPHILRTHIERPDHLDLYLTLLASAGLGGETSSWAHDRFEAVVVTASAQLARAQRNGEVRPSSPEARENDVRVLLAVMDGLELQWRADPSVDVVGHFETHRRATFERWGVVDPGRDR